MRMLALAGTGSFEIPVLCLLVHGEPKILTVRLISHVAPRSPADVSVFERAQRLPLGGESGKVRSEL